MISNVNVFLSHLGVRFPETSGEACRNVRWKFSVLTRCSQVVISTALGCLGLGLERSGCFKEHPGTGSTAPTLSTTLSIPLGNASEGTAMELALTTMSSLLATNNTTSSGGNETDSILTTLASIVTENVTDSSVRNSTNSSGFWGPIGGAHCPREDYCLPLSGLQAMCSGILCVWTLVKMVNRCRNGQRTACVLPLVHLKDGLLVMASGLGFAGNALMPTCYSGAGGPYPQVCDHLGPVVLASSVLYFTHAGLLVFSAVCANRPLPNWMSVALREISEDSGQEEDSVVIMDLEGNSHQLYLAMELGLGPVPE